MHKELQVTVINTGDTMKVGVEFGVQAIPFSPAKSSREYTRNIKPGDDVVIIERQLVEQAIALTSMTVDLLLVGNHPNANPHPRFKESWGDYIQYCPPTRRYLILTNEEIKMLEDAESSVEV